MTWFVQPKEVICRLSCRWRLVQLMIISHWALFTKTLGWQNPELFAEYTVYELDIFCFMLFDLTLSIFEHFRLNALFFPLKSYNESGIGDKYRACEFGQFHIADWSNFTFWDKGEYKIIYNLCTYIALKTSSKSESMKQFSVCFGLSCSSIGNNSIQ